MNLKNKLFQNIGKKIINCPSCKKRIRLPIKPGKTLEITCPKCRVVFQIAFKSPILELFKYNKHLTFKSNLHSFWCRIKLLPIFSKFFLYLAAIMVILFTLNTCPDMSLQKEEVMKRTPLPGGQTI